MALTNEQKEEIKDLLRRTIKAKLQKYKRESAYMPFLSKLIQDDEKVAAYSFIQSISTTLGMSIYEQVSVIIAKPHSQEAERSVKIGGTISEDQNQKINQIITEIRNGVRKANNKNEIKEILSVNSKNGRKKQENNIADFYMKKTNQEYYFEIKTAKPNIDVFTKSKEKLLEWVARKNKSIRAVLVIPYNPYYPELYTRFTEQGVLEHGTELLVAEEYWDFLGGENTFTELLEIFDEIGKELKVEIQTKIKEVAKTK